MGPGCHDELATSLDPDAPFGLAGLIIFSTALSSEVSEPLLAFLSIGEPATRCAADISSVPPVFGCSDSARPSLVSSDTDSRLFCPVTIS